MVTKRSKPLREKLSSHLSSMRACRILTTCTTLLLRLFLSVSEKRSCTSKLLTMPLLCCDRACPELAEACPKQSRRGLSTSEIFLALIPPLFALSLSKGARAVFVGSSEGNCQSRGKTPE